MEDRDAWFDHDGEQLIPRPHAHAPWADDMLHGRYLAGLAAREVEAHHFDDGWFPARLTIDLFRAPRMTPLRITSTRVRDGRRVRVVDVSVFQEVQVAVGRALVVRSDDVPMGRVWQPEPSDIPHPDELSRPSGMNVEGDEVWQFRAEPDRWIESPGPSRAWMRDAIPIVAGEPMTPFERAAMASDFASPLANAGPDGLDFINADITLNLARLPTSEWIGFETVTQVAAAGVSAASCTMFDLTGPIGQASVSAIVY